MNRYLNISPAVLSAHLRHSPTATHSSRALSPAPDRSSWRFSHTLTETVLGRRCGDSLFDFDDTSVDECHHRQHRTRDLLMIPRRLRSSVPVSPGMDGRYPGALHHEEPQRAGRVDRTSGDPHGAVTEPTGLMAGQRSHRNHPQRSVAAGGRPDSFRLANRGRRQATCVATDARSFCSTIVPARVRA